MNGVEAEVGEEGSLLVLGHEGNRFLGESIGEVFALGSVGKFSVFVRRVVSFPCGLSVGAASLIEAKSLMLGMPGAVDDAVFGSDGAGTSEMPLAKKSGGVVAGLEGFGEGDFVQEEMVVHFCFPKVSVGLPSLVVAFEAHAGDVGSELEGSGAPPG